MVTIRPAIFEDLDALCGVLEQLPFAGPVAIDRGVAGDALREILALPHRFLLVAERDQAIVGSLDLIIVPNLIRDARPHALIENVVVAPAARRSGVGRALLEDAIDRARSARCYKVQLLSNVQRVEAHRLYESTGFEPRATGYRLYF